MRLKEKILLVFLALAGLALFLRYNKEVSPIASVRLSLSPDEIVRRGDAFLSAQGFSTGGMTRAVLFGGEDWASIYIQKKFGLRYLNALSDPRRDVFIPVYAWTLRWFVPLRKEEFNVGYTTNGKLVSYARLLPEDQMGAALPVGRAKAIALAFVRRNFAFTEKSWDLIRQSSERKKARVDHYFTWKLKEPTFDEADLRLNVGVAGDRVNSFTYYLKVPEAFTRRYSQDFSLGSLLRSIAGFLTFAVYFLGFVVFVVLYRRGQVDTRFGLVAAGTVGLCSILLAVNAWPLTLFSYDTEIKFSAFRINEVVGILLGAVFPAGFVFLLASGCSGLLGRGEKRQVAGIIPRLVRGRIAHPGLLRSAALGYAWALILLGYQMIIYLAGRKYLGVWSPAGSDLTAAFASYLPALAPLLTALFAGVNEEITYRLAGFTIIRKYLRVPALAVLLSAAIWAFMHSTYQVFPVYFRGIELTVGGLLFFLVFFRYGLLSGIIAHFTFDLIWMSMPLLEAPSRYFFYSGVAALAVGLTPVIPGVLGRRRPMREMDLDVPSLEPSRLGDLVREAILTGISGKELADRLIEESGLKDRGRVEQAVFLLAEVLGARPEVVDTGGGTVRVYMSGEEKALSRALALFDFPLRMEGSRPYFSAEFTGD